MRALLLLLLLTQAKPATPAKKRVIRLDAITVEGRIQKPQAFYILQRSQPDGNLSGGVAEIKRVARVRARLAGCGYEIGNL